MRRFFGPSEEEIWDKISREIGGKIIRAQEEWKHDMIEAKEEQVNKCRI